MSEQKFRVLRIIEHVPYPVIAIFNFVQHRNDLRTNTRIDIAVTIIINYNIHKKFRIRQFFHDVARYEREKIVTLLGIKFIARF